MNSIATTKTIALIFGIIISYTTISSAENNSYNPTQNIINVSPTISPMIYTTISVSSAIAVTAMASALLQDLSTKFRELADASLKKTVTLMKWISKNKMKTTLICAAMSYVYIHYRLLKLKKALMEPQNWSFWHISLSPTLSSQPPMAVAKALVIDVQRCYTKAENPENFISPLVSFLRDVEQEETTLKEYISLCSWLNILFIGKICLIDAELYQACSERLKRLDYLKSIFLQWVAEYKFARNTAAMAAPSEFKQAPSA